MLRPKGSHVVIRRILLQIITAAFWAPLGVAAERAPDQVFREVAPAVVVITKSVAGQNGLEFSVGSGFVVQEDGIIVTAFHVVAGADYLTVKSFAGQGYVVERVLGFDAAKDLCVLKINADHMPVLTLGDSDNLKPGQQVLLIGAPLGLEYTVAGGMFSGVRSIQGVQRLQYSAPSSPGNSGGPLLDVEGRVIGVLTSGISEGQQLNFATPINTVEPLLATPQKMTLEEFKENASRVLVEAKDHQELVIRHDTLTRLARVAENAGNAATAIQGYEGALALCTSAGGDCLRDRLELLRVLAYFGSIVIEKNDVLTAGKYGARGVQLLETSGGVEEMLRNMQALGFPREGIDGFRENTFGACYWFAGLAAVKDGDFDTAHRMLQTLRKISQTNATLLEQAINNPSILP